MSDLTTLRGMVNEPTLENWDDDALGLILAEFPLDDAAGNAPTDAGWTPTYDMNRAAAHIWDLKAAKEQDSYDFSMGANGNATYKRSQLFTHSLKMARHFRCLAPMRATELVIDREDEEHLKSKWGGYPSLLVDPDPTHGGVFVGGFVEEEGDF